jgi:acetoin:2,6-dichlorophenolindophenol oxidoreductase subunit beta
MPIIKYQQAIRDALAEAMRTDPSVILMGEDIGAFGGLTGTSIGIIDEFGSDRVIETPISEAGFVGAAIGAALGGFRPVLELGLADVILVAMDQIVNQGAKMNYFYDGKSSVPIVFRVWSGFRPSGGPQMAQSNEAMFAHVPGLKVVMPSTPYDVKGLLKSAVRDNNPVIFYEPKLIYSLEGEVPEEDYSIPLGKAEIKRKGKDITVIALGAMVPRALNAADVLGKEGISVEVLDPRTLKPLDTDAIIQSVKKTGRVLIVHEANVFCGFGAEIAATIAEHAMGAVRAPIRRLGSAETHAPVNRVLERQVIPTDQTITDMIRSMMKGEKSEAAGGEPWWGWRGAGGMFKPNHRQA